jgi:hypothetical protein
VPPRLMRATPREKKPYKTEILSPETIDERTVRLLELLGMVVEFGRLALGMAVMCATPDDGGRLSTGEFRVSDVFSIKKRGKKDPAVVRTGPHAEALTPIPYIA